MESSKTISKAVDKESADFLLFYYSNLGFLLNRSQIIGSISIENPRPIKSPISHLRSLIPYEDELLLLYNFQEYLRRLFRMSSGEERKGRAELALIVDVTTFSERSQLIYKKIAMKGSTELSSRYMALQVDSLSEMAHIPLAELKPIPGLLRETMIKRGILGIRFPKDERLLQYLCDIEILTFNAIVTNKEE